MGTIPIIPMPAHPMVSTVRSGLWAEYSSVLALGITGVMGGTGVTVATVMSAVDMDAATSGVTDAATLEGTRVGTMGTATPATMPAAALHAATLEAIASTAEAPSAVAVEVDTTVAAVEVASMAEADPMVADTGNSTIEA